LTERMAEKVVERLNVTGKKVSFWAGDDTKLFFLSNKRLTDGFAVAEMHSEEYSIKIDRRTKKDVVIPLPLHEQIHELVVSSLSTHLNIFKSTITDTISINNEYPLIDDRILNVEMLKAGGYCPVRIKTFYGSTMVTLQDSGWILSLDNINIYMMYPLLAMMLFVVLVNNHLKCSSNGVKNQSNITCLSIRPSLYISTRIS